MTSAVTPTGNSARVTVSVAVPPERAFRLFTEEINLWWRRRPRFRNLHGDQGIICLESRVGGRVFESMRSAANESVIEVGHVMIWQPPLRLVFEWRASNFAPDERTEVEVTFVPSGSGTRVSVEHRGWSAIRADHPVRHGKEVAAFVRMMGLWWGDQMTMMRAISCAKISP